MERLRVRSLLNSASPSGVIEYTLRGGRLPSRISCSLTHPRCVRGLPVRVQQMSSCLCFLLFLHAEEEWAQAYEEEDQCDRE